MKRNYSLLILTLLTVITIIYSYKLAVGIRRHPDFAAHPLVSYVSLSLYIANVPLAFLAFKNNRLSHVPLFRFAALCLILFVFGTILFSLCVATLDLHRKLETHLGLSCFLFIATLFLYTGIFEKTAPRWVEFVFFQIAIVVILLEIVITIWIRTTQSPLAMESQNVHQNLYRFRPQPGQKLFGFPVNSMGFHDEEFSTRGKGRIVANSIADSFGVGVVPYHKNFLTVAEKKATALSGAFVYINNFSAPAIGMPEYVELYRSEVTRFPANLTILCIFIGNDIENLQKQQVESIWNFSHWNVYKLGQKLWKLQHAKKMEPGVFQLGQGVEPYQEEPSGEDIPTFSEQRFLEIETDRLKKVSELSKKTDATYTNFFIWLNYFCETVREPLLIVLMPDEFQVNDDLYAQLMQVSDQAKFDRFLPQKRINDFCQQKKIPCLDLLPDLRAGEKSGRVYRPRDTHWNSKGNQIAGEAIATKILTLSRTTKLAD